jgi:rRNA maturation endonuclease Nob1
MAVYNPSAVATATLKQAFANMVECLGCHAIWVEFEGKAREVCPRCGRENHPGMVQVNSDNCPDVRGLDREGVMVIWDEEIC